MTLEGEALPDVDSEWLFDLANGKTLISVEGLVLVDRYRAAGRPPEEVSIIEKARSYGAHSVFFEKGRHGRPAAPQAFIFVAADGDSDDDIAVIHRRLWSWGGVPLLYRAAPGQIQLFRCAHQPDFVGMGDKPVCNPVRTLAVGADIAADEIWWDARRLENGTIWDDAETCSLMLSAQKSAHRKLVSEIRRLSLQLEAADVLDAKLRRRLLILSLMIAYLEERSVLQPEDFALIKPGTSRFFEVLGDGPALVSLLEVLEGRFNGHVFSLEAAEQDALRASNDLIHYARLIEGYQDSDGQQNLWRLYSFRDLPVELISNIYQLFVKDAGSSIYTPPALVRLMLEEVLSWDRLDRIMQSDEIILDPACGSGVFLVEAFKRLVLHWRSRNGWKVARTEDLRPLLYRVFGVDLEEGAVELAAFSLCLAFCDALVPEDIRASVKLFPPLAGKTLFASCFFAAKQSSVIQSPVGVVVGNPPFASTMTTDAAETSKKAYEKVHGPLADQQLAYLFLNDAMELLAEGGILAMVEPAGFLYNHHAAAFRKTFFERWRTRELLDFVSVRGMFKKGGADPIVVVVVAEAQQPKSDDRLLHAVFRRNGRATAEQGFDIDYYDLHWIRAGETGTGQDIWRANLLGGPRVRDFIERLRNYPTLRDFADEHQWDYGEGFFGGQKNASSKVDHLIGKPLLPTDAITKDGIVVSRIQPMPEAPVKDPKNERRFTSPRLLIKEQQNLYHGLWTDSYLVYKNEIVGIGAPVGQLDLLRRLNAWLDRESVVLQAYVAGISSRMFTQRATAIFNNDIMALPYPTDEDLDLSDNERIIAADIVDFQRDYVRLGAGADVMKKVRETSLDEFDDIFKGQINAIYRRKPLTSIGHYRWAGAICKAYSFGNGKVDWSDAGSLHDKLDALIKEKRGTGLTITRVTRLYDKEFVFLLKPDRHRFWMRSTALRDADDVLADLRAQGF
jgi:hypothetical protein